MEEYKNQCPFCNKIFETPRKRGCHQRLCELNPKREEMLNALRKGGSITFTKLNKTRTLERKEYVCICLKCQKEYTITCTENDYNKGNYKKYCSRTCANSRIITEEHKNKIKLKILERQDYSTNDYTVNKSETTRVFKKDRTCKNCGNNISYKSKSGYCKQCITKFKIITEETKEKLRAAGLKSCSIQSEFRRSKNEKAFCELCEQRFNTVRHNEPIFNGWDADVIIEDLKVAILWNGKWHYEKITKNHSVEQVQNRDNIKLMEITKAGYTPYIIKDLGKFDLEKVNTEFKLFLSKMGLQD